MSAKTTTRSQAVSRGYGQGGRKGGYVIRVSVEICSGRTHFRAEVCAESIEHALRIVKVRYPGAEATVIFPITPEAFFASGRSLVPGTVLLETQELEGVSA
jgi:hypothetical protein